jgi:hypothetical protein
MTSIHKSPSNCTALEKVAIIVPFRNREEHLKVSYGYSNLTPEIPYVAETNHKAFHIFFITH